MPLQHTSVLRLVNMKQREGEISKMLYMSPLEQYIKDNLDDPELEQKLELFKTKTARHKVAVHGTISMYNGHKCRCDECRAAWAERMRTKYR